MIRWGNDGCWTIRDSFESVMVSGGIGAGKSTGPLRTINRALLMSGRAGGLYLCVKEEDALGYIRDIKEAGRESDLIVFGENSPYRFDFIRAELSQGACGLVDNLTQLLMAVASSRSPMSPNPGVQGEAFFRDCARRLCRCGLDMLQFAGEPVTVHGLLKLISSAAGSREELTNVEWQGASYFFHCLQAAEAAEKSPMQAKDFELDLDFFIREWIDMGSRTRGSVQATLTAVLDPLARGLARELLSGDGPQIGPERCWEGKLIVVNLPVLKYREVGRSIQLVIKTCWQMAAGRRDISLSPRPCFIFVDEAHWLASDYDWIAQTTMRSSRQGMIVATQNISNWFEVYGDHSEAKVSSLLGNFALQIFAQQTDAKTISYLQALTGRRRQLMMNAGASGQEDWTLRLLGMARNQNAGFSECWESDLQADDLNSLHKGGPPACKVETIIFQSGKRFESTGRTWRRFTFAQR